MRVLVLLCVVSLSACTTWRPVPPGDIGGLGDERPGTVRVLTTDGSEEVVRRPYVDGDSLRGIVEGEPASYALSGLTHIRSKETDELRTLGAVYLGIAAAGLVAAVIYAAVTTGEAITVISGG